MLGLIVEAIGEWPPIVAMPYSNCNHIAHPRFGENVDLLRSWGVTALWAPTFSNPTNPPGHPAPFSWVTALDQLRK